MDATITQLDSLYIRISCERHIAAELYEYFSFYAHNYKFMPKYKAGIWDGKIRLFDYKTNKLFIGLLDHLLKYLDKNEYSYNCDGILDKHDSIDVLEYTNNLTLPFIPYEYQLKALETIINDKKRLIESATSSGKSYIQYLSSKYLIDNDKKVLIIVPTTSLVEQMHKDFISYDKDIESCMNKIYSGYDKDNTNSITISTWQSVFKLDKEWFENFDALFIDEAHLVSDTGSLKSICEKCTNVEYRCGFTGTVKNATVSKLTLIGLFGPIYKAIKAKELIDKGYAAKLTIDTIVLEHNIPATPPTYELEINHIISNDRRNKFILKLANSKDGNVIILYQLVEKHGKKLLQLSKEITTKKVFIVHKDIKVSDREYIREYCSNNNDAIIIASYATFSTGISIPNLTYGIFAHPLKSKIKVLQSLGRLLRKYGENKHAIFYDIGDYINDGSNTTYNHFLERLKMYKSEKHDVKIRTTRLKI